MTLVILWCHWVLLNLWHGDVGPEPPDSRHSWNSLLFLIIVILDGFLCNSVLLRYILQGIRHGWNVADYLLILKNIFIWHVLNLNRPIVGKRNSPSVEFKLLFIFCYSPQKNKAPDRPTAEGDKEKHVQENSLLQEQPRACTGGKFSWGSGRIDGHGRR